jgi:hypothetical protein
LHYRRLRHYWQGKGLPGGGASLADGIDLVHDGIRNR